MSMADFILPRLQGALKAEGLPHTAVVLPAADESVDAEIEIHLDGRRTAFSLQCGDDGWVAANEEIRGADGELEALRMHAHEPPPRIGSMIRKLIQLLKKP